MCPVYVANALVKSFNCFAHKSPICIIFCSLRLLDADTDTDTDTQRCTRVCVSNVKHVFNSQSSTNKRTAVVVCLVSKDTRHSSKSNF